MTKTAPKTESMPYLGRCKECDFALFYDGKVEYVEDFRGVRAGEPPHQVGNNGVFARCPNRHKVFRLQRIEGKFNPDHPCDSRCLNAKGHDCTCACGGINHGRGHALKITTYGPPEDQVNEQLPDADRHQAEVTHTEDEPTKAQLDYIRTLCEDTGKLFDVVMDGIETRAQASELINDLKAIKLAQYAERRESDPQPVSAPMSDRQRAFINKLMEERQMGADERKEARKRIDEGLTKAQATRWISRLLELPEIS